MATKLNPYINYNGNAREAMEFYQSVFGGELHLSTFKEYNMSQSPADDNKIMHAQLEGPHGMTLMAADVTGSMGYQPGSNFSISLSGEDEGELRGYFDGLAAGGTVLQPFEKAPWGDTFGMVTDKFGVLWLVNLNSPSA